MSIAPAHVRVHNGSIDAFGFTHGVRALDGHGFGAFEVRCSGPCTQTEAASWSPDGSRLAFSVSCGGGCGSAGDPYHGVRIFEPATGTDRLILPGDGIRPMAWSPDGSRIAYAEHGHAGADGWVWDPATSLMVMDADGGHQAVIISGLTGKDIPDSLSWSPDGSRLVYTSSNHTISVVGLDGSDPRMLTYGSAAAWSPDGDSIAFLSGCEVRIIKPDGSDNRGLVDLLTADPLAETCGGAGTLVWSPDGRMLAALVSVGPADPQRPSRNTVLVFGADGSNVHVTSGGALAAVFGLTWQPIPVDGS